MLVNIFGGSLRQLSYQQLWKIQRIEFRKHDFNIKLNFSVEKLKELCWQDISKKNSLNIKMGNMFQRFSIEFSQQFPYKARGNFYFCDAMHCVKNARIRNFSGPHFPAFGLNTERYGLSLRI